MKLKAQDLQTIVNATLEHYNRRAEEFWAGTRDHDVIEKAATPILWRFSGHSPCARLRPVVTSFARVEEPVRVHRCNNIGDFRSMARRRLPGPIFHYIDGAADDEVTYRRNTEAYERCDLVPNVLAGVESIDMSVTVMGQKIDMPLFCAPTALQRLFHHDGERAVAKAAEKFGTMFGVSSLGTISIEEIGSTISTPKLFQLYFHKDRADQQHDRAVHRRKFRRTGADRRYDHGRKPGA